MLSGALLAEQEAYLAQDPDLTFDPESHIYRYKGELVPSVTGILKGMGFIDDRWFTEEARERGRLVHLICEYYDRGTLDEGSVDPLLRGYLKAWKSFRFDTGFIPRLIEFRVYHPTFRYAGTLDREGTFSSPKFPRPGLLDIKSGEPQAWTALQTGGYDGALPILAGAPPCARDRYGVGLRSDGTYRLKIYPERTDKQVFYGLAAGYHWRQKHLKI